MEKEIKAWAFAAMNEEYVELIYNSLKKGEARFGWSWEKESSLIPQKEAGIFRDKDKRQLFLLEISQDDYLIYVNFPKYGKCVAAKAKGSYYFDEVGLYISDENSDYRHVIPIDVESLIEFDRRDPNILPNINLSPRQRKERIYAVEDLEKSLDNLKNNRIQLTEDESKEITHLKIQTAPILNQLTHHIHKTHKGKDLEKFFKKVFEKVPNVVEVTANGFGWGTDNGADLIVKLNTQITKTPFEHTVVVQLKSYGGEHFDLGAVDQIKTAIDYYKADAGIIITTAQKTEILEKKIGQVSDEIEKPIDLIAGDEVAQFVMKHSPELLFNI